MEQRNKKVLLPITSFKKFSVELEGIMPRTILIIAIAASSFIGCERKENREIQRQEPVPYQTIYHPKVEGQDIQRVKYGWRPLDELFNKALQIKSQSGGDAAHLKNPMDFSQAPENPCGDFPDKEYINQHIVNKTIIINGKKAIAKGLELPFWGPRIDFMFEYPKDEKRRIRWIMYKTRSKSGGKELAKPTNILYKLDPEISQ